MKRISKRVREEAICALSCCANDRLGGLLTTTECVLADRANVLADAAWDAARRFVSYHEMDNGAARYLEAAAILRGDDEHEPWSPGDPTYLRGAP